MGVYEACFLGLVSNEVMLSFDFLSAWSIAFRAEPKQVGPGHWGFVHSLWLMDH